MQNFLSLKIQISREVTIRTSSPGNVEYNIKLLKKRVDEFGEAGGVIGTESNFPQSSFTNLLRLKWTNFFFFDAGQLRKSGKHEDFMSGRRWCGSAQILKFQDNNLPGNS